MKFVILQLIFVNLGHKDAKSFTVFDNKQLLF